MLAPWRRAHLAGVVVVAVAGDITLKRKKMKKKCQALPPPALQPPATVSHGPAQPEASDATRNSEWCTPAQIHVSILNVTAPGMLTAFSSPHGRTQRSREVTAEQEQQRGSSLRKARAQMDTSGSQPGIRCTSHPFGDTKMHSAGSHPTRPFPTPVLEVRKV